MPACAMLRVVLCLLLACAWLTAAALGVITWVEVRTAAAQLQERVLDTLVKLEEVKPPAVEADLHQTRFGVTASSGHGHKGLPSSHRPSAHLAHTSRPGQDVTLLAWGGPWGPTGDLLGGMLFANGSLTVPRSGPYFIYSQLQLEAVSCGRSPPPGEVVHSVRLTSNATASTVLSRRWSPCAAAASGGGFRLAWFQSSHLGGVLNLASGDSVAVHVSHGGVLATQDEHGAGNFFGAFLV